MKNEFVLCHYSEIALKGGNRNFFERQLIENIKTQLEAFCPSSFEYVKKMSGGILIKLNENGIENHALVHDALMHTPGIANFSFATNVEQNIETLKNFCWDLIKNQEFETFRVTTQRSNKNFPMTSEEINREVGGYIYEKFRKSTKGGPASGWKNVLVHDVSRDTMTDVITHVDFYEVRMDEKITANIPLVFIGDAPAVSDLGGTLVKAMQGLEVRALPTDLPHQIEVNISQIRTFDDNILVGDIKLPKGVEILENQETSVAAVAPPRSEAEMETLSGQVEEKVEEVAVETEEKVKERSEEKTEATE